jgi:DNA-binding NarL/FixJ family response regulator
MAYVNQDWLYLKELPVGLNPEDYAAADMESAEYDYLTSEFYKWNREKQVVTLLKIGLSRAQIAKVLGITRENLRSIIVRMNKKRCKESK